MSSKGRNDLELKFGEKRATATFGEEKLVTVR